MSVKVIVRTCACIRIRAGARTSASASIIGNASVNACTSVKASVRTCANC